MRNNTRLYTSIIAIVTLTVISFPSCDDNKEELNNLTIRVDSLENRATINEKALQELIMVVKKSDYVTSVTPLFAANTEIGYTISFANSNPITIYNGKDGDNIFVSVSQDENNVYFKLADGALITLPKQATIAINLLTSDIMPVQTNRTYNVRFTITSNKENVNVEILSSGDIRAKITFDSNNKKKGVITINTGNTIDEYNKIVIIATDGNTIVMKRLSFEESTIKVSDNTEKTIDKNGGEVKLDFLSNKSCKVIIPQEAQDWIHANPQTKALTKNSISIYVDPNIGYERTATVKIVSLDEEVSLDYTITQTTYWTKGIVPPNNEIWYITSDGKPIYLEPTRYQGGLFDVNIISNTYENGRGVIRCNGPITLLKASAFSTAGRYYNEKIIYLCLPNSVKTMEMFALRGLKIPELRIPDSLEFVEGAALNLPNARRFIGSHTTEDGRCVILDNAKEFEGLGSTMTEQNACMVAFAPKGISSYSIPSQVKILSEYTFAYCPELKEIILNEGLEYISNCCFFEDTLDCNIVIPSTLKYMSSYAFIHCSGIKGFYGNDNFHTPDNLCLTTTPPENGLTIIKFAGEYLTDYTVPDGIKIIGNYAFDNLPLLETVTFPSSIVGIESYAFYYCNNLKAIYGDCTSEDHKAVIFGNTFSKLLVTKGVKQYCVPKGITELAGRAFSDNSEIEEIILNDEITTIRDYAFAWCGNLKKIILSSKLKKLIGSNPFLGSWSIEEIYFRSFIPPTYNDTQFEKDGCKHLTVYVPEESLQLYRKSGLYQYAPYMKGYRYVGLDDSMPDYISSDFSEDGKKATIQNAVIGGGIDIILMGDGFSDRQIADGTYAGVMQDAMNAFFAEEPYKSFKDYFNVYSVNVVSMTEGYEHSGQALGTGHGDATYVYGNDAKVIEYAKKAISEDKLDDAVIIVMMNEDAYAGTCYMYDPVDRDYGRGTAIAYFPTNSITENFNGLVLHEAGGHGFAKLADEYAYEYNGAITQEAIDANKVNEPYGWWKNVDFTSDPTKVKWSTFISDSRYTNENIGCYEGGLTYWSGVWRPTEESIMRYNTGGFNAPSRYAIWYRINKLAFGDSWNGTYEDFVEYDAINRTPSAVARRTQSRRNYVENPLPQLAPPVVVGHSWREAK